MKKINFKELLNHTLAGFVVAVLIAFVSSVNIFMYMNKMKNDLQTMYEKDFMGQNNIQIARINLLYIDREIKSYFLESNYGDKNLILKNIEKYKNDYITRASNAELFYTAPRGKETFVQAKQLYNDYVKLFDDLKKDYNHDLYERLTDKFNALDKLLDNLDDLKQQKDLRIYKNLLIQNDITIAVTFIVLIVSLIIRIIIAINKRKITRYTE